MNTMIFSTVLSLVVSAGPSPSLVRVAIVDNSASMQGPRIAAVRAELTNIIRQLPPSPEFPIVLIVFDEKVEPTVVLNDQRTAERTIAALQGSGAGTHIGPALARGRDELLKYRDISSVLVMLYTDGEDDDQDGVRRAEAQLDALFRERSKRGLSQSVFIKRWDNANAELIARLRAGGHVQVLDAGELSVAAVTIMPAVEVLHARRDPDDPHKLQVTYLPSIALKGGKLQSTLPAVCFTCLDADVEGGKQTVVRFNVKHDPCTLSVPIPDGGKAPRLIVSFRITPMAAVATEASFLLPIVATSTLSVPVPVPGIAVRNRLSAEIRQARSVGWQDAETLQVRCQVTLAVTATAMEAIDVDRGTTFRIDARSGLKRVGDATTLRMSQPGTSLVTVTIDVPLAISDPGKPAQTIPIELTVQPIGKPDYLTYDPPLVCVRQVGLAAPDQSTTTITPVVRRIGRPTWSDLVESLALFEADVLFRVEGSIPQDTTLSLIAPGNIRGSLVPPGTTLHTGETTVTLRVVARLTPGKPERLDFSIVAPPPTAAARFHVVRGFSLSVTAPPAARLICVQRGQMQRVVPVSVADSQLVTEVTILPVLAGMASTVPSRLPGVALRVHGANPVSSAGAIPLFKPHTLKFRLPPVTVVSFFRDSKQQVEVDLSPDVPTPAVLPGRLEIEVTRQAPFKRLLTYLTWAMFPLGVLAILAKMFRRLREPVLA